VNIQYFSPAQGMAALLALLLGANPASASLLNRWSFNEASGAVPAGTVLNDSVSSLPMTVRGQGATRNGSRIALPGTTNNGAPEATISAYLDLPNGIISTKANFTFECWAAPLAGRDWAPLLDFGRMNYAGDGLGAPGEWTGNSAATPPAGTQADDALTLLLSRGTDLNLQRQGTTLNGTRTDLDTSLATTAGQTYHYVLTVTDNANGMQVAWYRDGVLVGTRDLAFHLSAIEDVNCWLGRLQWTGLGTANVAYDEVRLYNHALTPAEVIASRDAGPNVVFPPPVTYADATTMHLGQKVRVNVLANDTGIINPATVAIVQAPQSGTAVPDSAGQILYTHTSGTPLSDSFTYTVSGAGGVSAPATVSITFATSLRIPNANLNVPPAPPATTYTTTPAFGTLPFNLPINLATVPGDTQRLFVVQRGGVIRMIPNVAAPSPGSSVFLDLAALCTSRGETLLTNVDRGLMSMAFHPQHAANGRFFVWYSVMAGGQNYYRISRFNVQAGDPNLADTASEAVLIQQLEPNGFHLGTDMHFGTDGYLYVSAGDGGGQNDSRRNGQRIDFNFHCALMRLDVDKRPGNPEPNLHASVPRDAGIARYSIPADNPFVTANPTVPFNGQNLPAANVRTEFFSVGLRNPFRFSVDAPTGEIWIGDVGQDAREEINLAANGANFGWSWREGTIAGPNAGEALPGFTYTNPLYEYVVGNGSFQGHSVTGGIVYRGTNISSLTGAYIFADYVDGHVWALRRTPGATVERLTGNAGFVAFCADPSNGDVLAADIQEGRIYRLVAGTDTGGYPTTLSATGLFADLSTLSPAPGLLPYTPNLSFWSDFAIKRRWFTVPDASTLAWAREGAWTYPTGTIWVKHFDLETTRGNPATAQRVETRVLVKTATGSYGVSYRWNAAQTEATLVADAGETIDINVTENGTPRVQHYRIPSRGECITCHNTGAGPALSFNTRQLNRAATINGFTGNQIDLLRQAGYFANTPEPSNVLPRHVRPDETQFPLEARVRSYLAVNCANCHAPGLAIAPASWDARPHVSLADTLLIQGNATQNGGNPANRLIVPGDVNHSIVLNRIATTNGFTRMPPLGSNELDQANIALLSDWIANTLPSRQTYADWRLAQFGSASSPEGDPAADPDSDQHLNRDEYLSGTPPTTGSTPFAPSLSVTGSALTLSLTLPSDRSFQVETSPDLITWSLWDVPGNQGLPSSGGPINLISPLTGSQQFFRVRLWEN
jgi:uncharacterized repeat protein (TIGR03806 family)